MSLRYPAKYFSVVVPFITLLLSISGCEKKDDSVIDSSGSAPTLLQPIVIPDTIHTRTLTTTTNPEEKLEISFISRIKALHPQGQSGILEVLCSVTAPSEYDPLITTQLFDDGKTPDSAPHDSIFSATIKFSISKYQSGKYLVKYFSRSTDDYQSQTLIMPLIITRLNQAPVLSDLSAPSSVNTSLIASFIISLKADDPDGSGDIKSVVRMTQSGNIYPLNDSGANGDATANDGIYTETVTLNPPPAPGDYVFRFRAIDFYGDTSNVLTKTITIFN